MKKETEEWIWGCIAFVDFFCLAYTVGANEAGRLADKWFIICFFMQLGVLVYCLYNLKAFIWQIEERNEKDKEK